MPRDDTPPLRPGRLRGANLPPQRGETPMSGMKRRIFIVLLVSAAVAWPLAARGQQPVIPVIGYFSGGSPDAEAPLRAPFLKALAESGFHEADQGAAPGTRVANPRIRRPP